MNELIIRTFDVVYEGPSIAAASTSRFTKKVCAAYFQQGLGNGGNGTDGDGFVVFKDCQHKPVFTVRASAVVTIEEVRDTRYSAQMTPEMQARWTACSAAAVPPSTTTTFTTGGPVDANDAGMQAVARRLKAETEGSAAT